SCGWQGRAAHLHTLGPLEGLTPDFGKAIAVRSRIALRHSVDRVQSNKRIAINSFGLAQLQRSRFMAKLPRACPECRAFLGANGFVVRNGKFRCPECAAVVAPQG